MPSFHVICGLEEDMECGPDQGQNKNELWSRCWPDLVYLFSFWFTCGIAIVCLWPGSGKQQQTAQVASFHAVCGPHDSNFAIWEGIPVVLMELVL